MEDDKSTITKKIRVFFFFFFSFYKKKKGKKKEERLSNKNNSKKLSKNLTSVNSIPIAPKDSTRYPKPKSRPNKYNHPWPQDTSESFSITKKKPNQNQNPTNS